MPMFPNRRYTRARTTTPGGASRMALVKIITETMEYAAKVAIIRTEKGEDERQPTRHSVSVWGGEGHRL